MKYYNTPGAIYLECPKCGNIKLEEGESDVLYAKNAIKAVTLLKCSKCSCIMKYRTKILLDNTVETETEVIQEG